MEQTTRGRLSGGALGRRLETAYRRGNERWAVRGQVQIGTGLRLGAGSSVWSAHGLEIGDFAAIGRQCTVEVDGTIGHFLMTGAQVLIVGRADHDIRTVGTPMLHTTWVGDRAGLPGDRVDIGDDVWIGAGAAVLGGVSIGSGAVIGAGSVVTKDVAAFALVAGNPARQIGLRFPESRQQEHLDAVAALGASLRPERNGSNQPTTAAATHAG